MYTPKPLDTNDVEVPAELISLLEEISKNVHEVWAAQRINEGWKYGVLRDDLKKTTPCLVPYEKLPETEKVYDRKTALETLKFILKMGYSIKKDDNGGDKV